MKIAIDGPSGAGKSTIAKALAKKLGYIYIDTGAMYRTIGLFALRKNISLKNQNDILPYLNDINIDISYSDGEQQIFLNNENVTGLIRTPEVSKAASDAGTVKAVREKLVAIQRALSESQDVIMDGRDVGTHILPDAEIKIFLTASPEKRAERRYKELIEKGVSVTYDEVLKDMIQRDKNDTEREFSPLMMAEDAVLFDSSGFSLEETIEKIASLIEGK